MDISRLMSGGSVKLDGRSEAVHIFDGETVVFYEQFDVVLRDGIERPFAAGDFDGYACWA